jgi:mono/diheme cytochrome c family protein
MRTVSLIAVLALAAAAGGAIFVRSGLYDISATDQHIPPVYWAMETTMKHSVERRGRSIPAPPLGAPEQVRRGLALYRVHCVQCHGAPGVAPEPFALGLTPLPAPLVQTGREWPASEIYWVVKHGIKMTGMPAWEFRLSEEDIWAVVALVQRLPSFSPEQYRRLLSERVDPRKEAAPSRSQPDADRGKTALRQYACVACHDIPGITGPAARVGPPLGGIGSRQTLGGVLPNSPENLILWIRSPRKVAPLTAMPELGVTDRDARDMAAYLATLK